MLATNGDQRARLPGAEQAQIESKIEVIWSYQTCLVVTATGFCKQAEYVLLQEAFNKHAGS
jgi:hypothetical protein